MRNDQPPVIRTPIYQLDAFTTRRFAGNPAAVMVMERFADDAVLQALAIENALSETAFLVRRSGDDDYDLRWFTPGAEVPLCGHATLASAAVVMERLEPQRTSVVFHTASGPLAVRRDGAAYVLDFPARPCAPTPVPHGLAAALGVEPLETHVSDFNYLVVLDGAATVRALAPDLAEIARLDRNGLIVTARGDGEYDLVSRYFAPKIGVPEDPVTGSAHCVLAPFWSPRLGKDTLRAWQASARGGEIVCRSRGDRVELEGSCVFFLKGEATF